MYSVKQSSAIVGRLPPRRLPLLILLSFVVRNCFKETFSRNVGRRNTGGTTSLYSCQNCSERPSAEKSGKWSLPNRPICPPDDPVGQGTELNWTEWCESCLLVVWLWCRRVGLHGVSIGLYIGRGAGTARVGKAPNSRSKGSEFESRQEWRENFLLQS